MLTAEDFMLFFEKNTDQQACLAEFDKLPKLQQRRLRKCFEIVLGFHKNKG